MQVILKRLAVWLFETSCEMVLLGSYLTVFHGYDQHAFGKDLLFFASYTALLFFTTGYLLTTAIFRAFWRNYKSWSYPAVAIVLFLIHFEILNVGVGGAFIRPTGFVSAQLARASCLLAPSLGAGVYGGAQAGSKSPDLPRVAPAPPAQELHN